MADEFEVKATNDGLTLKLYRGEGAALLAFDLAEDRATRDFVGFTIEVKYPGATTWGALRNRLSFTAGPDLQGRRTYRSTVAPFQKFRWIHVPTVTPEGNFTYRLTARYMDEAGALSNGPSVEAAISLAPVTIDGFVNVGFTRAFASSQAYADRFDNETGILPALGAPAIASLQHDMEPFGEHYDWLGFEVRRLIYDLLDEVANDATLKLDALIYECKEPEILRRLEAIGNRLRAIIDDHGDQGVEDSCETESANRLTAAGASVKRMHFGRQQHNKVLLVTRNGQPVKVLAGSTNFSLRGLYIQANNALLFEDATVAKKFAEVFDAYWTKPDRFRQNPLSKDWWTVRDEPGSMVAVTFSPRSEPALSMTPIAEAIETATSSVLYSVVFLNQITGPVRSALDELMERSLFSYGVAQRTGGLAVRKPDGSLGLLPFAFLAEKAPEPFKTEWSGNTTGHSNMVHHKFVVLDFNGEHPVVFTGSSNMAAGGEKDNGDHLIRISDRKVAIAYAIEALKLFDHFHFRVNMQRENSPTELRLAKPASQGQKPWFEQYYRAGHVKERDRKLFVA
jgi:hypothetical protein